MDVGMGGTAREGPAFSPGRREWREGWGGKPISKETNNRKEESKKSMKPGKGGSGG